MSTVIVGRQPICNRRLETYAYELLYRSEEQTPDFVFDGTQATASVAINTIFEIGIDRLVGPHKAFINMTRSFLTEKLYQVLPAEKVVLEVLEDIEPDDVVLAAVREAKSLGYSIALDDFVYDEKLAPLIALADLIKVEVPALDRDGLIEHVRLLKKPGRLLLAEKVETHDDYEVCRDAGYELFQGYFFCKPKLVKKKRIPSDHMALIQLLARLHDPETNISDVERVIQRNVTLSYMLLRIVNSSFYAHSYKIETIHQAIVLLGFDTIQRCVSLLLMTTIDDKPQELMMTALVRARFCERCASLAPSVAPGKFFTVGLLSVMDALLDLPMEKVLDTVPLASEIQQALLHHHGPLGDALEAAVACERSNASALRNSPFDLSTAQESYLDALNWAFEVQEELAGYNTCVSG